MAADGREGGFIKLHRRLESWPLWRAMSAAQRMVWVQLLLSANWKDAEGWYGTRRYTVRRGQLALSEAELAKRAKVGRQVVRDTFDRLTAEQAVNRAPALSGTQVPWLTTIINYDRFQATDDTENPDANRARTTGEPTENQSRTPIEEGKKGRSTDLPPSDHRSDGAPVRAARLGVGHPAWEVAQHWTSTVWPAVSPTPCLPVTTVQAQRLAQLAGQLGPDEVKARMDRAASDAWWRERLSLDAFLDNPDRFAARTEAPAPTSTRGIQPVGKDWSKKLTMEGS